MFNSLLRPMTYLTGVFGVCALIPLSWALQAQFPNSRPRGFPGFQPPAAPRPMFGNNLGGPNNMGNNQGNNNQGNNNQGNNQGNNLGGNLGGGNFGGGNF